MKYITLLFLSIAMVACNLEAPPAKPDKAVKGNAETKTEVAEAPIIPTPPEPVAAPEPTLQERISSGELSGGDGPKKLLAEIANHPPEHLFQWLVQANELALIKTLVAIGMKDGIVAPDSQGRIPLHYAHSAAMVRYLWNFTSGPSHIPAYAVTDELRQSPLHVFANTGFKEGVEIYVQSFCRRNYNMAAMAWEAVFGNILNNTDIEGRTALHRAVRANDSGIVDSLAKCASVDVEPIDLKGRTPLHDSAELPDFAVGFVLLRAAKERSTPLKLGLADKLKNETPLQIARRNNSQEAIGVLEALELLRAPTH